MASPAVQVQIVAPADALLAQFDWAWARGVWEARGNYTTVRGATRLMLTHRNRALLERFAAIVGAGQVRGPYKSGATFGRRDAYRHRWECDGPDAATLKQRLRSFPVETKETTPHV